jgi:hypothetical protein
MKRKKKKCHLLVGIAMECTSWPLVIWPNLRPVLARINFTTFKLLYKGQGTFLSRFLLYFLPNLILKIFLATIYFKIM